MDKKNRIIIISIITYLSSFIFLEFPWFSELNIKLFWFTPFWHRYPTLYILPVIYLLSAFLYIRKRQNKFLLAMLIELALSIFITIAGGLSVADRVPKILFPPAYIWTILMSISIILIIIEIFRKNKFNEVLNS